MSSPKRSKTKLRVGILGATGTVGQRFIALLENHPWFDVTVLGAGPRSAGKVYKDIVQWKIGATIPSYVADLVVQPCDPEKMPCDIAFSALDSSVAGEVEEVFAKAGVGVFSNSKNHRQDDDVPIVVPLLNADHLDIIAQQKKSRGWTGFIVTAPNCSTSGMATVLKALQSEDFGIDKALVVTMQAISGAGYPGCSSWDMIDNVVPFISGEEDKLENECNKILGGLTKDNGAFDKINLNISAHCNRVPVVDGHTECLSFSLKKDVKVDEVAQALNSWKSPLQKSKLPSLEGFSSPIIVRTEKDRPQPRLDRCEGNGFSVTVGRIRECPVLGFKLTLLVHNTILGAAGGAILTAEIARDMGHI